MSGPKVIDIAATRHLERLRIEALCARIDSRLARYQRLAGAAGNGAQVDADWTRKTLSRATTERPVIELMELTRAAARQLDFVREETDRRRERPTKPPAFDISALRAAEDRLAAATSDEAVHELLHKCQATADPAERLRIFQEARQLAAVDSTDPAQALADGWREADGETSYHEAGQPRWRTELDRIRAELPWLREASPGETARIDVLLAAVEAEPDSSRRELALTGARLEIAELLAAAREAERRDALLAEWLAAGADVEIDADAIRAMSREDFESFSARIADQIEFVLNQAAAAEGRREILNALARLGYELNTGMETAFVEDGRIVIRKPDDAEYGVELAGMGATNLMKTRVVRLAGEVAVSPDARLRDQHREETWCADRAAMQADLARRGIDTTVKAARPAGASPVPRLNVSEPAPERRQETARSDRSIRK